MTEPTHAQLIAKWESAKRAWNRDGGPIERTIKAGEDLYFAAEFLISALLEGQTWQPIAIAPRDGTEFIAYSQDLTLDDDDKLSSFVSLCAWHPDAGLCTCELRQPTHWMPFERPDPTENQK